MTYGANQYKQMAVTTANRGQLLIMRVGSIKGRAASGQGSIHPHLNRSGKSRRQPALLEESASHHLRMDEAAVLGRWIDPSRALKLVDVTQPLHPRRVNEVLLGGLRRPHGLLSDSTEGNGKRDVFMDGVCDERGPLVLQGAE